MTSTASFGSTDRIAALSFFNSVRAGSGTRTKYSSTVRGGLSFVVGRTVFLPFIRPPSSETRQNQDTVRLHGRSIVDGGGTGGFGQVRGRRGKRVDGNPPRARWDLERQWLPEHIHHHV